MQCTSILRTIIIWVLMASVAFCVTKRLHRMLHHGGPDIVAADEQQSVYPPLDLEDTCKGSKNPKCEAIIDNYCIKSCSANLCAEHGSIRGMCRLMCEAEDLPPQCLKMGPSMVDHDHSWTSPIQVFPNQPMYPYGNGLPQ
jgi:hypothetical protein